MRIAQMTLTIRNWMGSKGSFMTLPPTPHSPEPSQHPRSEKGKYNTHGKWNLRKTTGMLVTTGRKQGEDGAITITIKKENLHLQVVSCRNRRRGWRGTNVIVIRLWVSPIDFWVNEALWLWRRIRWPLSPGQRVIIHRNWVRNESVNWTWFGLLSGCTGSDKRGSLVLTSYLSLHDSCEEDSLSILNQAGARNKNNGEREPERTNREIMPWILMRLFISVPRNKTRGKAAQRQDLFTHIHTKLPTNNILELLLLKGQKANSLLQHCEFSLTFAPVRANRKQLYLN